MEVAFGIMNREWFDPRRFDFKLLKELLAIAINYLLIPILGIEGAAIATLAGYAISDVVGVIVLQKMKLMKIQPRFILATGMMVIFILI